MHGHGKAKTLISGLLPEALLRENQSVPANPADRANPEEKKRRQFPWRDIGDLNTDPSFLYPDHPADEECPVPKNDYLSKENQQAYMQWIEKILDLDRRTSKDPRLYCGYCDMNNHPRFACKHAYKHQKPNEKHRCTLCTAFHPPFLYSRAQINGGRGKPNWSRIAYKRAKQESREPDLRWGVDAAQVQPDCPTLGSQSPSEAQQPQCAAAAMMHGLSRGASSSWQGGCPPIDEHQEWSPPVTQQHVILPESRIQDRGQHLAPRHQRECSSSRSHPLHLFLRHCNTMDSPPIPTYLRGGPQPADDIVDLSREASMENLRELQRYAERLQFEATCVRLWANGIQDQIMDEQEKVQNWISGMIGELNRLHRVQPAWIHQLQAQGNQQPPVSMAPSSSSQPAQASSSSASTVPAKAAPRISWECSKECSFPEGPRC